MCLWCQDKSRARLCCLSLQAPRESSKFLWRLTKGKQKDIKARGNSSFAPSLHSKMVCLWNFTGGMWMRASFTPWSQQWLSGAIRFTRSWRKTPLRLCWKAETPHHTRSCSSGITGQHLRGCISTGKHLFQCDNMSPQDFKVELFWKFLLVLLIIVIWGHLCCQVKNGVSSPVLLFFFSFFFLMLTQQNELSWG